MVVPHPLINIDFEHKYVEKELKIDNNGQQKYFAEGFERLLAVLGHFCNPASRN